jgi:hypothetical protein
VTSKELQRDRLLNLSLCIRIFSFIANLVMPLNAKFY